MCVPVQCSRKEKLLISPREPFRCCRDKEAFGLLSLAEEFTLVAATWALFD